MFLFGTDMFLFGRTDIFLSPRVAAAGLCGVRIILFEVDKFLFGSHLLLFCKEMFGIRSGILNVAYICSWDVFPSCVPTVFLHN